MRKIFPVVIAGATVLAAAGGTFGYAVVHKDVTLSVDGQALQVSTAAGTVGDLLADQGITPNEHDVVAPAPGSKLVEGTRVAVQFGREVEFTVDGRRQTVWTTATSVDAAMGALGVNTAGADVSTSRSSSIGRQGLAVEVDTRKKVSIDAAGKRRELATTAGTVGEALAAAEITPDEDDLVSPTTPTRLVDGAKLTYTRVDVKSVTERKKIAYEVVRKSDSGLAKGKTMIDRAGRTGTRMITYRVVRHNSRVDSRTKIASEVTEKPRTKIIRVGTKKAPSVASGGVWDKIAKCESGGNWSIDTGNGYYGGLQFSKSTWRAYGGSGSPADASRAEQITIAKKVQKAQGWGAWPGCTAKLGLR